jgi:hypothetical protein
MLVQLMVALATMVNTEPTRPSNEGEKDGNGKLKKVVKDI